MSNDVRQTEMHMSEQLVPVNCSLAFRIAIEKLKRRKSPGVNQISAK
jgi:hypothetical protein